MKRCWFGGLPAVLGFVRVGRLGWGVTLALAGLALSGVAGAQTACPGRKPLTLPQVEGFLKNQIPDDRIMALIDSCHTGFRLDGAALDGLAADGVSDRVMEVLNRSTISGLTLAQARADVAALESHMRENEAAVDREAGGDAAQFESQYQQKRAEAARVSPKSEFETTAAYNARVQQAQETVAQLDAAHDVAKAQLGERTAAATAARNKPEVDRIALLKAGRYPAAGAVVFGHYDADAGLLTATLGGEEYWFEHVAPQIAESFHNAWGSVRLEQPYADGDPKIRILVGPTQVDAITGQARSALVAARVDGLLRQGQAAAARGDYGGAARAFKGVLALEPGNEAAKTGLSAAMTQQQQIAAAAQALVANREWVDPRTRLMWTQDDNNGDISWKEAIQYCQNLRKGGFSDWRLPAIDELEPLYDAGVTRQTPPLPEPLSWYSWASAQSYSLKQGAFWQYHVAGGITLTRPSVWSSSKGNVRDNNLMKTVIYVANFVERPKGNDHSWDFPSEKHMDRALCVRPAGDSGASSGSGPVAQPGASADQSASSGEGQGAGTWMDRRTGRLWTTADNGSDISHKDAEEYCRNLQAGGVSGWRLPTIAELQFLIDLSLKKTDAKGRTYHIAGEIQLTHAWSWSGTQASATGTWAYNFENAGKRVALAGGPFSKIPTLCVHD